MSLFPGIGGTLSGIASENPLSGIASSVGGSVANLGLEAVVSWVLKGTEAALDNVAQLIGQATTPQLESSWFSGAYWQVAALASLLTLPFLFAAAVQSVLRADLTLLTRAAFVHLPVALLGVALAAPVITLLLSATDEMCSLVSGAGSTGGATLLDQAATVAATATTLDGSPFFAFVVGLIALAAALALTLELTIRAAAVYVVVLMLPLAFAAMVWPARRVWAVRVVELLTSLILSKFVIVAVLSLAGAAFAQGSGGTLVTAMTLLLLATFSPWALMRLLPFTEVAAAAAGGLRSELSGTLAPFGMAASLADGGLDVLASMTHRSAPEPAPQWGDGGGEASGTGGFGQEPAGGQGEAVTGAGSGGSVAGEGSVGSVAGEGSGGSASPAQSAGTAGLAGTAGSAESAGTAGLATTAPTGPPGNAESAPGSDNGAPSGGERLPGFGPIWQAEDGAWPEMTLGPDGWAGPTAYAPDSDGSESAPDAESPIARPEADER